MADENKFLVSKDADDFVTRAVPYLFATFLIMNILKVFGMLKGKK